MLDLYCCAGGASEGYRRAGFEPYGVDKSQKGNYPFRFLQADALDVLRGKKLDLDQFVAIHASPPCQRHTRLQFTKKNAYPDYIARTRELLERTELPYIIENVPGAPLRSPFELCGTMFGLELPGIQRSLWRHRLFEANWEIGSLPPHDHVLPAVGIYGDHLRLGRRSREGEVNGEAALILGRKAMQIGWMDWSELTQAIPPAYTHFIGERLLAYISGRPSS